VHRSAHQREPHRLSLGEHAAELVRVEAREARPEGVVGRHRRLRQQAHQALERRAHRHVDPPQEQLALEQRAVQCARCSSTSAGEASADI
jgi:hypothetical protein